MIALLIAAAASVCVFGALAFALYGRQAMRQHESEIEDGQALEELLEAMSNRTL